MFLKNHIMDERRLRTAVVTITIQQFVEFQKAQEYFMDIFPFGLRVCSRSCTGDQRALQLNKAYIDLNHRTEKSEVGKQRSFYNLVREKMQVFLGQRGQEVFPCQSRKNLRSIGVHGPVRGLVSGKKQQFKTK